MENGTVRILIDGSWHEGNATHIETETVEVSNIQDVPDRIEYKITLSELPEVMKTQPIDINHPEPFNDGKYLHYTRFHKELLKKMIGTEGYFYSVDRHKQQTGKLESISPQGNPVVHGQSFCYFAVPIKPEKTEITLQEIADKFGVAVGSLRIKE